MVGTVCVCLSHSEPDSRTVTSSDYLSFANNVVENGSPGRGGGKLDALPRDDALNLLQSRGLGKTVCTEGLRHVCQTPSDTFALVCCLPGLESKRPPLSQPWQGLCTAPATYKY